MAYKDLLVHVDDTRSCAARLQAAVDLAAAHEAHLTGVYIIAESPAVFATGHVPPELLDSLQQRTRERAEGALARFAEVAGRNQISFETRLDRVLYTEVADALATNARYADLAIVGQADPDDGDVARDLPEEVTLSSGRPSLVILTSGRRRPWGSGSPSPGMPAGRPRARSTMRCQFWSGHRPSAW